MSAARVWLRILVVADVILAVVVWGLLVALMHSGIWGQHDDIHSWGEYAQVTLVVLGGSLAIVAALAAAARWLIARGFRRVALVVAGLPLEAAFGWFASSLCL